MSGATVAVAVGAGLADPPDPQIAYEAAARGEPGELEFRLARLGEAAKAAAKQPQPEQPKPDQPKHQQPEDPAALPDALVARDDL